MTLSKRNTEKSREEKAVDIDMRKNNIKNGLTDRYIHQPRVPTPKKGKLGPAIRAVSQMRGDGSRLLLNNSLT